jgi:hypothetical protein
VAQGVGPEVKLQYCKKKKKKKKEKNYVTDIKSLTFFPSLFIVNAFNILSKNF